MDVVMNYKSLAAYTDFAEGTLRHKVMRGEIPFLKIGRSVRFLKSQIDPWLVEHQKFKKASTETTGGEA